MRLSFLKNRKWPRIAPPMEEKHFGLNASEQLEHACLDEMMEAISRKDVGAFRAALEALVLNLFEMDDSNDSDQEQKEADL